jgi:hypothetical protein
MVAGDTDLNSPEAQRYYARVLERVSHECPDSLTTFGLTANIDLPNVFADSDDIDFYSYQAGHRIEDFRDGCLTKLPTAFLGKKKKKPILNGEYTYEGHGYTLQNYGRYTDFDIRRGFWQSILCGAKAGIIYGAHGLWGWYRYGKPFLNEIFAGQAFPWRDALRFRGGWDVSFGKEIFDRFDLFDIEPNEKILLNENPNQKNEIRVATTPEKIIVYLPYSTDVALAVEPGRFDFVMINLRERTFARPRLREEAGKTVLQMHEYNDDVLYVGVKR